MSSISFKIAFPIILVGIFIIVIFMALELDKLNASFYVIFTLVAVYVFLFGFATGQKFSDPVKKILQKAMDLSEGNLTSRVYVEGRDELGELARIFNRIAEELEESRDKTEKSEKSVDIKVRAKTQGMEETIYALEQKVKNRTIELEKLISELEKFQSQAKSREIETIELKRELDSLKSKVGRYK